MNIFFISLGFPCLGEPLPETNVFLLHRAKVLSQRHKLFIITRGKKSWSQWEKLGNIEIYRVANYDEKILKYIIFSVIKLWQLRKKIDIIYAHFINVPGFIGVIAHFLFRKPLLVTAGGGGTRNYVQGTCSYLDSLMTKITLMFAQKIITPHPEIYNMLLQLDLPTDKFIYLPNVIDTKRFHPNVNGHNFKLKYNLHDQIVVLFCAELNSFKDPKTFVRAIPHVVNKNSRIKFLLVGDGPLMREIRLLAQSLKVKNVLTITGFIDNVEEAFAASNIVVLLSPIENIWSTVLLEALSMGKPLITTKSGYTEEFLKNGVNAILINPQNPKELAGAIIYLAGEPQLRYKMSQNNYEYFIKRFETDKWVYKFEEIIKSLHVRARARE